MNKKLEIEQKINDLQEMKRKKRVDDATKYQKFVLETYKNREMA